MFGGDKNFAPNPSALFSGYVNAVEKPVLPINALKGRLCIDTRNRNDFADRNVYLNINGERATEEMESDIAFERYIADLRVYQALGWNERLALRFRVGTSTGLLPPMYWFELGGLSTLRGYEFKAFVGNRMVLANIE